MKATTETHPPILFEKLITEFMAETGMEYPYPDTKTGDEYQMWLETNLHAEREAHKKTITKYEDQKLTNLHMQRGLIYSKESK